MSETQIVKPVNPSLRISTMDSHRLLTHPDATPPREGTQRPNRILLGGGQPERSTAPDMLLKNAPIEAIMGGGGAVQVKAPQRPGRARQIQRPELARGMTPVHAVEVVAATTDALSDDAIALCTLLVDEFIVKNQPADQDPLEDLALARETLRVLYAMAPRR
jgi:hypothetical protein